MTPFTIVILVLIIILVICIIGSASYTTCQDSFKRRKHGGFRKRKGGHFQNDQKDQSGWQLYMRAGCPHCVHQKAELKGGFTNYIEYAPGGKILENLLNEGEPVLPFGEMKGFPMWYNYKTKDKKMGKRDMCSLSPKIQGC